MTIRTVPLDELRRDVTDLAVVGLGYVGLPLVEAAVRAGLSVVGIDDNPEIVANLNAGKSHIDDLSDDALRRLLMAGFSATCEPSAAAQASAIVICVPTPLSPSGGPDLAAVESASKSVAPHLQRGSLVVLESTTYPGTTAEVVAPILEAGSGMSSTDDFHVAYSPERIDPGNRQYGFRNTPKIVGADTDTARASALRFYNQLVDTVVVANGTREAEAAKLLENTYRHVNIALVNELAILFHELEIDIWNVIELAATKPFGFQAFRPGPGVGGHCIPIDPNYLSHQIRSRLGQSFRFVELAQEINSMMPTYVANRALRLLNSHSKPVRGSRILLLGVTYKPDIADARESPAMALGYELLSMGADLAYHDPHIERWSLRAAKVDDVDLRREVGSADLVILVQNHSFYDLKSIENEALLLLDTRGVTGMPKSQRL
jgi:nucleotide sugar dehydrogenase